MSSNSQPISRRRPSQSPNQRSKPNPTSSGSESGSEQDVQKVIIETKSSDSDSKLSLLKVVVFLSISNMVLVFGFVGFALLKPDTVFKYFAVSDKLQVIELVANNEPFLDNDSKIISWVDETVVEINTLTFTGWRKELQSKSSKFTQNGFESFIQGLRSSGNLQLINDKRLNTIVKLDHSKGTRIIKKGLLGGVYVWYVEVAFVVNYEGSNGAVSTQRLVGTVVVSRVNNLETPVGIAISSYSTVEGAY